MLVAYDEKYDLRSPDPAVLETVAPCAAGDVRLPRSLEWFAYSAAACAATGALLYCYPVTLAPLRSFLTAVHAYSGDAAAILLGVYLYEHFRRTWTLRRSRPVSWWTGVIALLAWILAIVTGVYGQVEPLPQFSTVWWLHGLGSLAAVVVAGGHAVYGFRARASRGKEYE